MPTRRNADPTDEELDALLDAYEKFRSPAYTPRNEPTPIELAKAAAQEQLRAAMKETQPAASSDQELDPGSIAYGQWLEEQAAQVNPRNGMKLTKALFERFSSGFAERPINDFPPLLNLAEKIIPAAYGRPTDAQDTSVRYTPSSRAHTEIIPLVSKHIGIDGGNLNESAHPYAWSLLGIIDQSSGNRPLRQDFFSRAPGEDEADAPAPEKPRKPTLSKTAEIRGAVRETTEVKPERAAKKIGEGNPTPQDENRLLAQKERERAKITARAIKSGRAIAPPSGPAGKLTSKERTELRQAARAAGFKRPLRAGLN